MKFPRKLPPRAQNAGQMPMPFSPSAGSDRLPWMRILPPEAHSKSVRIVSSRDDVHAPEASLRAVMPRVPLPVRARFSVLEVYYIRPMVLVSGTASLFHMLALAVTEERRGEGD